MAKRRKGRGKGSRNKGYFFRTGRGWVTKDKHGKFIPLRDDNGERLRDENTPEEIVKAAHARWLLSISPENFGANDRGGASGVTVREVCQAYLAKVKAEGAARTFESRADSLFDFAMGFPARFRKPHAGKPKPSDRIHPGYGEKPVSELRPFDIDRWLQAHSEWNGARRTKIQAVKRALNYAVEAGLIERNPIKGYKTPKAEARVTYITPEQEAAMVKNSKPAIANAIRILIRTGARPGREFAALTAAHVRDHGDRMEWVFAAKESKTKKLRIIRITDLDVIAIVRRQIERYPTGPIFRNTQGRPWTREALSEAFNRLRERLKREGIELDKDCVLYSCRHTYAKRTLQGFWNGGKSTNIETLAKLMGNTPEVCRDHYLQWCDHYTEPLWEAC